MAMLPVTGGGGTLAGSFSEAGLITEYVISLIPVVLEVLRSRKRG